MAKDGDQSLINDVLEPFRRVVNSYPSKEKMPAATRLNFSHITSPKEGTSSSILGKRKFSSGLNSFTPDKKPKTDPDSPNLASPWEAKRLKIDLIAAKAQITKMETRLNHQFTLHKEMTILFEDEKLSLQEQRKRDSKAVADMEARLQVIRKREAETKQELLEIQKLYSDSKLEWEKENMDLKKNVADMRSQLLDGSISNNDQTSEMNKNIDTLTQELEAAKEEVSALQKDHALQLSRASQCTALRAQLDKQQAELQQANMKLKEMEFERDSYKEWQEQAKTAQKRLAAMPELEREVSRLRSNERQLRDVIGNKLLLEEQLHSLQARVDSLLPTQARLHHTQVANAKLESALGEWVELARARGASDARALGAALDHAQQKELTALSDKINADSMLAQVREELSSAKHELEKSRTRLVDVQAVQKNQESLIHRLQKKVLLLSRERDSYRNQLDCYEKDLTVTLTGEGVSGRTAALATQVESLERSLQGYRDLLHKMEQDMALKAQDSSPAAREQVQRLRDELENMKRVNDSLRSRRDQLEMQLEGRATQCMAANTKVIHLADNPAAQAQKQMERELENALLEVKRLKKKLHRLESEGAETSRMLETSSTLDSEVKHLKQQLQSSTMKLQRMKEEFTSSAQEYRDVCYMLMGYKIDRTGHKIYRLSSMYAESPDDYLSFVLSGDGIEMVQTDYSASLHALVELHLHQRQSIPLFLSALTTDLYTRAHDEEEQVEQREISDDDEENVVEEEVVEEDDDDDEEEEDDDDDVGDDDEVVDDDPEVIDDDDDD